MWICFVVYLIPLIPSFLCQLESWEPLGCWRDLPTRAIASLEGKSKLLSDNWKQRANPLGTCAEAAKEEKLKVFAVQDGGQCFGGPYAHMFYNQYGPSNLCKGGVGGIWSSNVYSSKTAYARILNTKKDSDKLVKCSRPLDMVFLIDGSGDSNVENKLRWDQMLKFVSKATEHFDTSSTRFGVISYGSEPKTVVSIHDNKDQLAMRDSIISASFPGGPRTINEALKKAWKEQLKYTDRAKSKVIVALTAGSMEYGPWGSSLFLTNRGVRLLSLGIDRIPSYRYLETLASGKHPENIYSIDSEQLDQTLPYFAKDVCTGFTKGKIETIRKDKEIEFISSHDFETVGSIVERKSEKGTNSTLNAVNMTKGKDAENAEGHGRKDENDEAKKQQREQEKRKEDKTVLDYNNKKTQRDNTSSKSDDMGNIMLIGPNDERKNDDNKTDQAKARRIFPVNNSSLSDGEIVERLKEDAVDVLKNREYSNSSKNDTMATFGEPMIREKQTEDNKTASESKAQHNQTASSTKDALSSSEIENLAHLAHRELATNMKSVKSTTNIGKERDMQKGRSIGGFNTTENKTDGSSSLSFMQVKPNKTKAASNESLSVSSTEKANTSSKISERGKKPVAEMSKGQIAEGNRSGESTSKFSNSVKSNRGSNQTQDKSVSFNNRNSNANSKLDFEDGLNSTKSVKKPSSRNQSSFEGTNGSKLGEENSKDVDKEIFDGLQQQRESIGQDQKEKDDEAILHEVKLDQDVESSSRESKKGSDENSIGEGVPEDENTIDDDERATQSALEQKRKEIDVLLKKLDETRRKRKRRKVRQRSKDSKDEDGVDDFEEADSNFMKTMGRHKDERKDVDNGMETGMKRRLHMNAYSDPRTRHFLLITQNDSKPFPVQRPLKAIPTAKAFKLLDKLYSNNYPLDKIYSHNNKQNMNLKYNIFDPIYSSKSRKVMTKSKYKKFKTKAHREQHKVHEKANILSTDKQQTQTSDRQQFFLRNGISSRAGWGHDSKNRAYPHQNLWHNENAKKKHIIRDKESKDVKKNKNSNMTTIDIKSALDEYYSYFLKHIQPFWKHGHREQHVLFNKSSTEVHKQSKDKSRNRVKVGNDTVTGNGAINHSKSLIRNDFNGESENTTLSNKNEKISTKEQSSEKFKTQPETLINVIDGSKAVNTTAIDMKPMSFKSLESIDSGNYTVYRFSENNVLINLQSKTGELRTFYGKSSVKAKRRTKPKHVSKLRKHSVLHATKNQTQEEHHNHHSDTAFKQKINHTTIHPGEISGSPILTDNLKYFQSSLQEEPGYARSFSERNEKGKQREKVSTADSHIHASLNEFNTNLTAYDLYDNRLAHIEKQRQYFSSDKHDPDRLVITENSDPYTDSSTVKLFVNAGDENSLMPAEPTGLGSHKERETKNLWSDISDDLSKKGNWDKYLDTTANDGRGSYSVLANSGESKIRKNNKELNTEEQESNSVLANSGESKIRKNNKGLNTEEQESNSVLANSGESKIRKNNKELNSEEQESNSVLANSGESKIRKNSKGLNSEEQESGSAKPSKSVLRKIVEEKSNSTKEDGKSVHKLVNNGNETGKHNKEEKNATKIEDYHKKASAKYRNDDSDNDNDRSSNTSKGVPTSNLTKASFSHESTLKHSGTEGDKKDETADEVWIFRPNPSRSSYKETYSTYSDANKDSMRETGKAKFSLESRLKSERTDSRIKDEAGGSEGLMLSRINQELGCTRPVIALYAIDVSDAIGTGPTRQRKWNHMKRFLRSVNDKVIHGGSMGFIVYDTEPRFLSNLEPCDEKTEYFVTRGECLCDHKAAWFQAGRSSCSTHAPTDDESVEDWGKQGPRTARALNFAEKILSNAALGDAKKLVVLVTHDASTDDVTGAERSLKENSISLVDIEIGERHNINKRSNRFDDVIPRDHQMEVSFYKLDKAIENIFSKICKEKDPSKTRRSRIFATLRKHRNWW